MRETDSPLEQIFESMHEKYKFPLVWEGNKRVAQGSLHFLELEQDEKFTRLLYADRVATADFYDCGNDCGNQRYLNYTILSGYQRDHDSFLKAQGSDLAKRLQEKLNPETIQTHRRVIKISLDDFSEVEAFLGAHLENY